MEKRKGIARNIYIYEDNLKKILELSKVENRSVSYIINKIIENK